VSKSVSVTVRGEKYSIDMERLTLGEGRAIERVTGQSFGDALGSKSLTAIQAIVWVTVKRAQPELKFSDLDDWAISDIEWDLPEADDEPTPDPTPADTAA